MGTKGLEDKVVVVTGANHGIGAGIARAFGAEGARVFLTYYRGGAEGRGQVSEQQAASASEPGRAYHYKMQTKSAEDVVAGIREAGGQCEAFETDLAVPQNIPGLFDRAETTFGPVAVVVNNAAYSKADTFIPEEELEKQPLFATEFPKSTITAESHDAHSAVNSRAVALMMAEFARRHIARGAAWGRIINISSDGARGYSEVVSYYASKWAAESFTRAAAMELGPYGITVNAVSPGAVNTGWLPLQAEAALAQTYPMRRLGMPQDIAKAVVFLASDEAEWITGQVLQVGGGNRM